MSPIEELLEKEAIKELRVKYTHFFDGQQIDALMDLFAEDAVCEFGEAFGGDWVGSVQIREKFVQFSESEPYNMLHSVTNPLIELIDQTTAHGRWYLHDLRTTEGTDNPLTLYGIYDDVYRKIDGRWLISRTRIDFLWPRRHVNEPREF